MLGLIETRCPVLYDQKTINLKMVASDRIPLKKCNLFLLELKINIWHQYRGGCTYWKKHRGFQWQNIQNVRRRREAMCSTEYKPVHVGCCIWSEKMLLVFIRLMRMYNKTFWLGRSVWPNFVYNPWVQLFYACWEEKGRAKEDDSKQNLNICLNTWFTRTYKEKLCFVKPVPSLGLGWSKFR